MIHRALVRIHVLLLVWSGSIICGFSQPMVRIYVDNQQVDSVLVSEAQKQDLINNYLQDFWHGGYLYSGVDSVLSDRIYLHQGQRIERKRLNLTFHHHDRVTPYEQVSDYSSVIAGQIAFYNESGYPFAQVNWDSVSVTNSQFDGWLTINTGPEVQFDSLQFVIQPGISHQFLESLLGFKQGQPYRESVFQNIPENLKKVPFLSLKSNPEIIFKDGKASIIVDLETNPKNQFEGIIGVFPAQGANNQTQINGFLNLQLVNLFRSAKEFSFHWEKFGDQSQDLNLTYTNPMFLTTAITLSSSFQLTKQDTSFLFQDWSLQGGTFVGNFMEFSVGYNKQTSTLINPNEVLIQNQIFDYYLNNYLMTLRSVGYGAPLAFGDFKYNIITSLGNKTIQRNINLDPELYENLKLKTAQLSLDLTLRYLVQLKRKSGWYQQLQTGALFGDQILTNELFRLGGLNSVRGFNERVFYAKKHTFTRQEFRQYFETQSYFSVLYDVGVFQDLHDNWNIIQGFGAGINLNTSNGLFNFVIASGKVQDIPADFTDLKIHFGYTSVF